MDDLELARVAARRGAEVIRDWSGRLESADFKGVVDPVTAADRESEDAISTLIEQNRPGDALLAEEGDARQGTTGRRWVVDPLDGTVNFVHGFPHVSVSIALEDDQGPIVAVVRDVHRDEEFLAMRGSGALLDDQPIRVSDRSRLGDALIATGFPYDRQENGPEYGRVVGEMLRSVRGIRRGGSAALDLAWVACGRVDGYWEVALGPWDVAAGFLLVREAGGILSSIDGGSATHESVVAANPRLHPGLRAAVEAAVGR